jgi:hypothetical protein
MIYLFQFSCFFMFSLILFFIFLTLWKNRITAFYSSFFVGLIGFFASLRNLHESITLVKYFGVKFSSGSRVIVGELDVLSRFLGLVVGLVFVSLIFFLISRSLRLHSVQLPEVSSES